MKSLMLLWKVMAEELAVMCRTSATQDVKTFLRRSEHEGARFYAVILPTYAKDLEKGLERGKVGPGLFAGFQRQGELPKFLGGFMANVFDRETGVLFQEPCTDSIYAIRQLTGMYAKMQPPGANHPGEAAAMQKFVECDAEVRRCSDDIPKEAREGFARIADLLFRDVFTTLNTAIYRDELVPKHGPGATADRRRGNAKFDQTEWTDRLESIFPYGVYAVPSERFLSEERLERVNFREPGAERPVRVITVPKTYKTPRIIAIEPTCMQYMQQAILDRLVQELEGDSVLSPLVGFTDQTPNQRLAWEGSRWFDSTATLDLSEASDRVSYQHVMDLLSKGRYPYLREAIDATRSTKADVLGHGQIDLAKFASMGSALCFPMEEMVFLTIIFLSIEGTYGNAHRFTRKADFAEFAGQVRVYGDDIVVPGDYAQCVIDGLEAFGLQVNVDKSFWRGNFRESCGKEYYAGTDVTLVRVRREFPDSRRNVPEVISLVELRNQLYHAGLWSTVRFLDETIEKVLPHFPVVEEDSPAVGRHSVAFGYQAERMCAVLHRPLVRGYVVSSKPPLSRVSGEGALLKFLLKRSDLPTADSKHLERSGRPQSSQLKLRWVTPF